MFRPLLQLAWDLLPPCSAMRRRGALIPVLFVALWWAAGSAFAAAADALVNTNFSIEVWDTDRGLPQNSVIAMTQTRDGYLWLGTVNGLARFDGTRFVTFHEGNTAGLNSSRIVKLFEDSRGGFWVGTESAGVVLVQNGVLTNLNVGNGTREGRVTSFAEDANGAVWMFTANGQLHRYYTNRLDSWNVNNARMMAYEAERNVLWVGTDWLMVGLGPLSPGAALSFFDEVPVGKLDFLAPSRFGGYWRFANGRVEKWKGGRIDPSTPSQPYPWPWRTPINAACEDRWGNLIVGTDREGVYWFLPGREPLHLKAKPGGLSHDTVLSLYYDREDNLWVGTDGRGLNRIKPQLFRVMPQSYGRVVTSVDEDPEGGLWVGYNADAIEHLSGRKVVSYTAPQGVSNLLVRSIYADRQGAVWAGTFNRGLLRKQGEFFLPAPGTEFIRTDQEVPAIYEDRQGRLLVGTQSGLAILENRSGAGESNAAAAPNRSWRMMTPRDGLSSPVIRAIAEDADGGLWVGTEGGGLNHITPQGVVVFGKTNGLPSENISALCMDVDGVLWVGTPSGLARLQSGKWHVFGNPFGAVLGTISSLLDDQTGYLWIGSNTGLLRVKKTELENLVSAESKTAPFRVYGIADGMPTRECSQISQPSACRTRDGTLWFATTEGLTFVDPRLLTPNTNPPPVLIEAVIVDSVQQNASGLRAPGLTSLVIPAGKESLEVRYTALNLSAPDKSRFRYRLDGHENQWTETDSSTRVAHYSKLPPGEYTFQVSACNEDNVWNAVGQSLVLRVLPPFWRTWWFITLCALVLLAAIVGSVHYVSTQRLQLQLATMRQHEALEHQRARIARDLHDQLGANLTQVALLGEMAEQDKDLPEEVEMHARQISQTARETTHALDEIVWTVNPANDTLDGLINYTCKYAQEYLATAGLRYRLETPSPLPNSPISPELRHNVFLSAKETINNVVKHSKANSVWLRLILAPDRFTLEIEDNGKGISPQDQQKGRSGLKNMRKRMEEIGGSFEIGPGADGGTRIRLTAPLPAANVDAGAAD